MRHLVVAGLAGACLTAATGCGSADPPPRHGILFAYRASQKVQRPGDLRGEGGFGGNLWLWQRGEGPRRLIASPLLRDEPAWSPDGKLVAFTSTLCPAYSDTECAIFPDVFVARSDGSNARRLISSTGDKLRSVSPSWSPDGSRIAFAAEFPGSTTGLGIVSRLGIVPATGGKIDWLDVSGWQPTWGRPGIAYLVWRAHRIPRYAIRLVNPSTGRSRPFGSPALGYSVDSIAWSSRGELAALQSHPGAGRPERVTIYSGEGRRIAQFDVPERWRTCGATWSPNGSRLLLAVFPAREARRLVSPTVYPQLYTVDPSGRHWHRLVLGPGLTSCHVSWR